MDLQEFPYCLDLNHGDGSCNPCGSYNPCGSCNHCGSLGAKPGCSGCSARIKRACFHTWRTGTATCGPYPAICGPYPAICGPYPVFGSPAVNTNSPHSMMWKSMPRGLYRALSSESPLPEGSQRVAAPPQWKGTHFSESTNCKQ